MIFEEVEANRSLDSWERRFVKKVVPSNTASYCTAYCLVNDICLLFLSTSVDNITKMEFLDNITSISSNLSGKRKKGSAKVMRGDAVCKLTRADGSVIELLSPIAGNVMEYNAHALSDASVLNSAHGEGYLVVIHRNKIDEIKHELCGNGKVPRSNICFDFIKGTCKRGELCRYEHMQLNSDGNLTKVVQA